MSLYNTFITYELQNNNTFIKIEINNNKVECVNKEIKKDIESKIQKINIINVIFYVSLYDYELIPITYFWKTIKNLEKEQMPIYKKNENIKDFFLWYNKNFNNNQIQVYETDKFTQRKTNFTLEKECLESIDYNKQSNPKFKIFNQLFFHAGDISDLERYGYIYIKTLFNKFNNVDLSKNIFKNHEIKIWNKFKTDYESIKNTMEYMFNKMKKGILIGIKNNKLVIFLPFSKWNYENDFYEELYFDENDKKLLNEYKKTKNNKLLNKLNNNVRYYLNKYKLSNKNKNIDRRKWIANDCFFKYENYEGDQSEALFEDFFVELCKNRKIPDCIFFLNVRDHPVLNKNLKDSYTSIVDKDLDKKYIHSHYAPILSVGVSLECSDIPLITQDDWKRVCNKIYPDDCKNGYLNKLVDVEWKNKKNIAVFRGSATGCHIDDRNVRIKASILSKQNPEYLDAGITKINRKLKKELNSPLSVISNKFETSNFMSLEEKIKFKYILNLDGHVSAFRLGHEFSLKSVLLLPKSKYYLWFSFLLKPYEHYIPIEENLDDLVDKIKWCITNDDKCYDIAMNGFNFYKKYLEKDGIYDYMQNILSKITPTSLNLKKYDKTIALITVYKNNKDNTRLIQKRYFLYMMNKLLKQICNYDIIVVEQDENYPFNIGKLKNIGFDYLNKNSSKKYDNYIFSDIDTIPNTDLIDYFFKITDSLNALGTYGTRYTEMDLKNNIPFVGALISCTKEFFEEINGYPNNFYGWQGEDENLLLRLYETKKPLYKNKNGSIIDTEITNGMLKTTKEKVEELNKEKEDREKLVYEKNVNYKNYKKNGLSNLNYDVIDKFTFTNNYHIIVNLKKEESIKLYPNDYIFNKSIEKDEYKLIKKKILYDIKQVYF